MSETHINSTLGEYYMKIRIGDYVRPKPFTPTEWTSNKVIVLPLPTELRDDTAVNYNNQDLKLVGDIVNDAYRGAVGSAALSSAGNIISGFGSAAAAAVTGAIVEGGSAAGDSRSMLGDTIGSKVGNTLANAFPPDQVTSALQQASGMAPNPNPSVAFAGPQLRDFTYSWTLFPKSRAESDNLQKIIKVLKSAALPQNEIKGQASVLKYPKMCQINFYPWDNNSTSEWGWNNNSIIKHKKCFLGAVNVSYTPSNVPAFFYENKNPVAAQLTLTFKEIEYFMSHDWYGELDESGNYKAGDGGLAGVLGGLGEAVIRSVPGGDTAVDFVSSIFGNDAQAPSDDPTQAADNG